MKKIPGQRVRAAGILLVTWIDESPEFLLMKHSDRWDLPKGHCDEGETFQQTALRETEEETGIGAHQIKLDPKFEFELVYQVRYKRLDDQVFDKQVRYFLGIVADKPEVQLTEHEGAQWHRWSPPHQIQAETIDPLLSAVAEHVDRHGWHV